MIRNQGGPDTLDGFSFVNYIVFTPLLRLGGLEKQRLQTLTQVFGD